MVNNLDFSISFTILLRNDNSTSLTLARFNGLGLKEPLSICFKSLSHNTVMSALFFMLIAALKSALASCPHSTHLNTSCVFLLLSSLLIRVNNNQYQLINQPLVIYLHKIWLNNKSFPLPYVRTFSGSTFATLIPSTV